MSVGILLLTHHGIGSALLSVATRLLGSLPLQVGAFELPFDADPATALPAASAALRKVDDGDGVLEYSQKIMSTPGTQDGLLWLNGLQFPGCLLY